MLYRTVFRFVSGAVRACSKLFITEHMSPQGCVDFMKVGYMSHLLQEI